MKVPLLDLSPQYQDVEASVRAAIERVLASQQFILGPEVAALEREIAHYSRVAHAVGVSSGTDALLASLLAADVGPGDEVVTTPFTFVATGTAIARLGARAAFVDIDPSTYLLDATRIQPTLRPRTKAIVPVHLFGQMADMDAILAHAGDVPVLDDAAQSIGSTRNGRPVGRGSRAAALSFFPSKNLGAMGDGGMVLTDDGDVAARLCLLRNQGQEPKYVAQVVGGNFRLDELQAAILRAKLPWLDRWTDARGKNAALYREAFSARRIDPELVDLPREAPGAHHVYHQLVLRTPKRDALRAHLSARGVATAVYYPVPLHLQPAFAAWGYRAGDFPQAERACRETLALPVYPGLSESAIAYVADQIATFVHTRHPG